MLRYLDILSHLVITIIVTGSQYYLYHSFCLNCLVIMIEIQFNGSWILCFPLRGQNHHFINVSLIHSHILHHMPFFNCALSFVVSFFNHL